MARRMTGLVRRRVISRDVGKRRLVGRALVSGCLLARPRTTGIVLRKWSNFETGSREEQANPRLYGSEIRSGRSCVVCARFLAPLSGDRAGGSIRNRRAGLAQVL